MGIVMRWISAPSALKVLKAARALLDGHTPLKMDCGRLCGAACCQQDETGENGMLLLPFEEKLYRKPIDEFDYQLVDDDSLVKGGVRLVCTGECPREHRPDVQISAELDPRAWAVCPLLEQGGMRAMDSAFITAVEEAGRLLSGNVSMLQALLGEQKTMNETRKL
jgi:hypothetical protein